MGVCVCVCVCVCAYNYKVHTSKSAKPFNTHNYSALMELVLYVVVFFLLMCVLFIVMYSIQLPHYAYCADNSVEKRIPRVMYVCMCVWRRVHV